MDNPVEFAYIIPSDKSYKNNKNNQINNIN